MIEISNRSIIYLYLILITYQHQCAQVKLLYAPVHNLLKHYKILNFSIQYLGSTVVKELRGTESTRKSIQKLKREERVTSAGGSASSVSDGPISAPGNATPSSKQPLYLSISHRGVQFIDIQTEVKFIFLDLEID